MTTFDKREEAFENRFAHDEELQFKARARRASKVAHWAAGLMRKAPGDAERYAETLLALQVNEGDEALIARLKADLAAANAPVSDHQLNRHLDEAMIEARKEVFEA